LLLFSVQKIIFGEIMEDVKLVNDGMAILSLRDSDFDAYSAYGEVVDNSIQARATWTKIKFDFETQKLKGKQKPFSVIKEIAFGDNGVGMTPEILNRCMQLGYSSRYNDRSGIGRFGVGMTLAAINQCKRVEIFSKQVGGDWLFTYVDIDEITADPPIQNGIPVPIKQAPPEAYSSIIDSNSGTLVIWKKYDRQPDSATLMESQIKRWMGRTYRKFLWEEDFDIYFNGTAIYSVDPLYVEKKKNEFPNDPVSNLYKAMEIEWPITDLNKTNDTQKKSTIVIKMSKLNEFHHPKRGSGDNTENVARGIHEDKAPGNEGISILRNNREVFYGHIPYWPKESFHQMDRWWGCEISFDAVLDSAFAVKNIKRGAVPIKSLKEQIAEMINPTRKEVVLQVQEFWKKQKIEEDREVADDAKTKHDEVEKIVGKTKTDKSAIDKSKNKIDEATKLVNDLMANEDETEKAKWIAKFTDQPFTIYDDSWKGPVFMDAVHLGGSDVLKYNHGHPFFETVYSTIKGLEEKGINEEALKMKQLLDILLISYSKAEAKFEAEQEYTAEDFVEYLKSNWGMYLQSYIKTWKKETQNE
jgi:hypothetical protein